MRLFKTSVTVFLFQNSASRTTLLSLLSLCLYGWVQPSDDKKWRDWSYERYFQHQEQLYQELQSLGIPGACRIDVNEQLAEEALKGAPKRVKDTVANIGHNIFSTNKKILFYMAFLAQVNLV